ncbi:MAG: ankyrin repeat domain-containing protein, partial [Proteobacteria bacterium]|nr:ankyrin repeat domain-containing protein [Pseudomonadota bacterium]
MRSVSGSNQVNRCFYPSLNVLNAALLLLLFLLPAAVFAMDANQQLFQAVNVGNVEGLRQALQDQADVNAGQSRNWGWSEETPLFIAVTKNNLEIAEVLLANGADTRQALMFNNRSLVYVAIEQGNTEMASLLIKHGAEVNITYDLFRNQSPLHKATSRGDLAMVKLLIDSGAKIIPGRWSHFKEV